MTVRGRPSTRMDRPTMAGSAPKWSVERRRIRSNSLEDPNAGYMALLHGVSDAISCEVERCLRVWNAVNRADAVLDAAAPWNEVEHMMK